MQEAAGDDQGDGGAASASSTTLQGHRCQGTSYTLLTVQITVSLCSVSLDIGLRSTSS